MRRNILCFSSLILFLVSCSNNTASDLEVLSQPPFDKLTDSIRQSPQNADLYYRRGILLYSNQQPAYAEQDIRTAWQLAPKEEYALSMTTLLREKSTDSALVFLQQALKKLPNSIALQIGLARGYQKKKQYDQALAICDAVSKQYPNQLDALIVKADILKEQNKNAEALAVMERAYSFAPNDKELAYDLAWDYAEAKNPQALGLTDSLIRKDSSETVARAYYVKATYYKNTGNVEEALKNYDASIGHDYNFFDSYLDKGELLYDQKRYQDAAKTFQLALSVSPSTADFYYWLGKTQEAMGQKEEAQLNYQRAKGLGYTPE
jgi:tetratricopeptide (TPR) repeat protein